MRTKAELEHFISTKGLATAESLTQRELTESEIRRMPEAVYAWHEQNNRANVEKALDAPRVKAENRKNAENAKTTRFWKDEATKEEGEQAIQETLKFHGAYPQFRGDYVPNRYAMRDWLREKSLPWTFENLVSAFEDLTMKGQIVLDPSALGIGTESEIFGHRLKTHPQLSRLLEPAPTEEQKAKLAERRMSAAEWKEAHKEDFRQTRLSDFQLRSWDQAIATFLLSNPTYIANDSNRAKILEFIKNNHKLQLPNGKVLALSINPQGLQTAFDELSSRGELELNESRVIEGQATRYTNLGGSEPGFPPKSDKYSFQRKIQTMSSSEYLDRINNDPAFREAVNALG